MLNFKPSKLSLALLSSGMIALSTSALAAEEAQSAEKKAEEEVEVIQVTGFRKSVVESINLKRYSSNVVEAISAEDIGKLPDSSIAESIARLPGLAAQRLDGRASKVSIRGFGENEGGTTLNGREQVSIGDNRGVEFLPGIHARAFLTGPLGNCLPFLLSLSDLTGELDRAIVQ